MPARSTCYLSIVGFSLVEPLLHLVDTLESMEPKEPNEVQTGGQENGYSAAIVVLSVLILESSINRVRYFEGKEGRRLTAAEYFYTICPDPNLATAVNEVFAVRDVIVHNHVWEAQIYWLFRSLSSVCVHAVFSSTPCESALSSRGSQSTKR